MDVTAGYRVPTSTARIDFAAGHRYHGAEVVMSLDLTIDQVLELQKLEESRDVGALYDAMGDLLLSWNLEDDDGPVEATSASLRRQPTPFLAAVLEAYAHALTETTSVPGPSAGSANDGDTSPSPS